MLLWRSLAVLFLFQALAWVVLLASRHGRGLAVSVGLLATLALLSISQRSPEPLLLLGSSVLAGAAVWRAVQRGTRIWGATLAGLAPVLLASGMHLAGSLPGRSWTELQHQVETLTAPEPASSDAGPEERALAQQYRDLALQASGWALRLLPAELLVFHLAQVLGMVLVAGQLARSAGQSPVRVLPVSHWRVPFGTVWLLAIGLALLVTRQGLAVTAGLNVVVVVVIVLSIQGGAVLLAFLERSLSVRALWLLLALAMVTAFPVLVAAAAVLGTADLWIDFRRSRLAADDFP